MERALIMAVDAPGNDGTGRARRCVLTRAGDDGDPIGSVQDLLDHKAGRDQRQKAFGQDRLSITATTLSCEGGGRKMRAHSTQVAGEPKPEYHSPAKSDAICFVSAVAANRRLERFHSWWKRFAFPVRPILFYRPRRRHATP